MSAALIPTNAQSRLCTRALAIPAVAVLVLCAGAAAPLVGVILALVISVGGVAATSPVRRQLERCMRGRARARRERRRKRAIAPMGLLREQQYRELGDLVRQIERVDPSEARRLELQELLDYYVEVAIAHQGCLDGRRLVSRYDVIGSDPARSSACLDLIARRRRLDDEVMRRAVRLADELDAIEELVQLIAQRVWWPSPSEIQPEIDRRLAELDRKQAVTHPAAVG